jgi:hypothetical protein
MKTRYINDNIREAIEIELRPYTISTMRVAFVSVNHGSLLSAP